MSAFDQYSVLLPRKRMNGATSSDNISVLIYTMACLDGLGLHATMDSEAVDGRFKYLSILFNIIINIVTNSLLNIIIIIIIIIILHYIIIIINYYHYYITLHYYSILLYTFITNISFLIF